MSIGTNEAAIPGRHTLHFRVRDHERGFPRREVEVLATEGEIGSLCRDGYLVRERLIPMEDVERLRAAFDEIVPKEEKHEGSKDKNFGGIFLRHMMDKHPTFLELLNYPPTLSVVRAIFGPSVQVRGLTGRICYADDPYQETEWHYHQRLIPEPLPPRYSRPQTLDALIYLDDIDDTNGPLCVVPGSHDWIETDLEDRDFSEKESQVVLKLPAGSCVMAHGSLWHRNLPTQPGGTTRRLLILGYGPCYMKTSIYGEKPKDGLTVQLLRQPDLDEETRELLGVAGYM